ncbi:MAG: spore cortex-lytic enzyme [Clostridia bacterium]|nr:spore cortex-lytic enzyme [Clostridia bacterium]
MKRLKICMATLMLLSCLLVFGGQAYQQSNVAEPVAVTIESVDAAVANTKEVQAVLKKWGYYTGSVDGINGPLTKAAVKKFQRKYGLTADGVVGPLTAAKMGLKVQGGASGSGSYNNNDLYLLAKLVHSEARGETYTGQVAVAAVVLNRVDDSRFPNTIAGVIYQPWAFTAINDGQFNLEPNQTAYQAARDAMNGWDPTYGAVYYYNPKTATSKWIRSTKTVTVIGQHVFSV